MQYIESVIFTNRLPTVIFQKSGHSVWLIKNGRAERRMVAISDFVENGVLVSKGISFGDTVISKGYQKMYNGAAVKF